MLGSIAYGTVEYAGLLPGGQTPRFNNSGKTLKGGMTKEAPRGNVKIGSYQGDIGQ